MKNDVKPKGKKAIALAKYDSARSNLLLMVALTLVNVVLSIFGSNTMLLFSATVPYYLALFGKISEVTTVMAACIAFALIILAVYFVCWLLSKKHYGWIIAALALFVLDTLALIIFSVLIGEISGILDFVIHVWVLYYLIIGVISGYKLNHLTPEDEQEYEMNFIAPEDTTEVTASETVATEESVDNDNDDTTAE